MILFSQAAHRLPSWPVEVSAVAGWPHEAQRVCFFMVGSMVIACLRRTAATATRHSVRRDADGLTDTAPR